MEHNTHITSGVRTFLKEAFDKKLQANAQYSLRAFAKFIGIDASTLSQIMSGKRPITAKRLQLFADAFEMEISEFTQNCMEQLGEKYSSTHHTLPIDTFHHASEWYHDAILELTHLESFQPDIKWIAQTLGLNYNVIKLAVERLVRLQLLTIDQDGNWMDTHERSLVSFEGTHSDVALRKYQKQLLDISKQSINNSERGERDHTSFIFSMDKDLLPSVHEKIKEFEVQLMNYINTNSKTKNHVQALQVSSFSLSSPSNNNPKKES